jgi:capsular polysaccharide biosynthesis protein
MSDSRDDSGFNDLISALKEEFLHLVRLEIELARTEISMNIARVLRHVAAIAVGGVMVVLSLLALVAAAIAALSVVVPPWQACLIVGLIICVVGGLLIAYGRKGISLRAVLPEKSVEHFKKTAAWLRGHSR